MARDRFRPRYVAGDFNHCPGLLDEIKLWQSMGWTEVQTPANMLWQWELKPTCKGGYPERFSVVVAGIGCSLLGSLHS